MCMRTRTCAQCTDYKAAALHSDVCIFAMQSSDFCLDGVPHVHALAQLCHAGGISVDMSKKLVALLGCNQTGVQ